MGTAAVALTLAACEADTVAARTVIADWGYTGVAILAPPAFGRPCRWGEPYAVRFTAHDASGAPTSGWLCAADESAEDARLLLDEGDPS